MKIGFIGAGNMAEAIISGMLNNSFSKEDISFQEISEERSTYMVDTYGIRAADENFFEVMDVIVFAVKPQVVMDIMEDIKDDIRDNHLIISIVAGLTTDKICKKLSTSQVVRGMPNTPSFIGRGITALCEPEEKETDISEDKLAIVEKIFTSIGTSIWTEEKYFNSITALSGSGPAYVYRFISALEDSGVLIGLPRELSRALVLETVLGSTYMAAEKDESIKTLENQVTSPGGTTINGVFALEEAGFSSAVQKAVKKAYDRAVEMAKN